MVKLCLMWHGLLWHDILAHELISESPNSFCRGKKQWIVCCYFINKHRCTVPHCKKGTMHICIYSIIKRIKYIICTYNYAVSESMGYWLMPGFWNICAQREGSERYRAKKKSKKSSKGTSIPTSFVFSTTQFTPVHLHLYYFHSNSRGAIRSIFDIGTWLWKRACHFSVNRRHEKKGCNFFPSFGVKVGFFKNRILPCQSLISFFFFLHLLCSSSLTSSCRHISLHRKCHHCTGKKCDPVA